MQQDKVLADMSDVTTSWSECGNSLIKCAEQKQRAGICMKNQHIYTTKKEKNKLCKSIFSFL